MNSSSLQGQYAGVVARGIALMIDVGIVAASILAFTWGYNAILDFLSIPTTCTSPEALGWLSFGACLAATGIQWAVTVFLAPAYYLFFWTLGGQTPGKALMGVRIVRTDGQPMSFARSFRRLIGYVVCIATLGLGFAWAIIDDRRQAWDDKLASTVVVYSWEARQNEIGLARVRNRLTRPKHSPSDGSASPSA